jgi:hypothetical protein
VYCYGKSQLSFLELPRVEFHEVCIAGRKLIRRAAQNSSMIDDLMNEVDQNVCDIFTKLFHHRSVSVVVVIQNLFHRIDTSEL